MKQSAKKLCSLLVVLCLLVGLVPFGAFAAESSDSGVEILYQQLILGDDLTMKFEIAIEESVAEMAEVKLTVGGAETVYTVSELTPNEKGNYLVSVDVAAAQMTDTITVSVAVGEFEIASKDYTVLAYAEHILNGNYGSATKALVKEMLNYGAKAQTYFDYKAGSLAEYENVTPATMPTEAEAMSIEGSVEGIKFYGSSMLFTGKLAIRYYFTAPNGVAGYTFTSNGNTYKADIKNGLYYVDVAGINPQDIDEPVVLTVSDESSSLSVGYGPMNYITRMYNGNSGETLKNLLQALYGYHLAAVAFVESGETQEEIEELAIPEGARMICDYSEAITPHIPSHWGDGPDAAFYSSYEAFEGRAGVFGIGAKEGTHFLWYNAIGLSDMDLSLAETITFRLKVKDGVRSLQIKHDDTEGIDILQDVTAFNEWIELTYNVAELGFSNLSKASIQLRFANPVDAGESEWIWLDQVYVTEREVTELAIPEGAKLICDYSEAITPNVPSHWGSGPAAAYSNSYDKKDGRAGVLGFGSNCEAFMWYTGVGLDNMDLSLAETITFRMRVDGRIRNLNIKHDNITEYNLYQHITVFDDWTEVTVNVADLNFADLSNASIQFQFATWNNGETEYVLLDQVYITERTITELPIPDGAKLICDYSEAITPDVPDSWGTGPSGAYSNSYDKKDGRAGVLGFGSNSEAFMWYTGVGLDNMDLSLAETITFRMKVDSRIRNLNIKHDNIDEYNLYQHITVFDEWTEVTVNVADLNFADLSNASIQFQFATWNNGETEYVLLDQVYITERAITELPIPEGAELICDYSEPITPHIPDNWGTGPSGAYSNSYDKKDGRAGVFGFGANGECFMWYNGVGLNDLDLSRAESITFRMKVDSRIRNLNIKHDDIEEFNLYQYVTVFDEWTEVTVPVAELGYSNLYNASIQFQFATWNHGEVEYVLLDQVYMTLKADEELVVPTQIPNYEKYRGEKKLDVLAFWMPPIEDIHYQWMQEAGITALVIDNQYGAVEGAPLVKALSLCDKYGIDAYIMISREQANALYPSNYPYVTDHPSLKGFYVDEPLNEEQMNDIAAMVKAAEPMGLTVIVNKMPWTDADSNRWFDTAFADCGDNLIVCATNYPLLTDGIRSDWLEINGLTAESAAKAEAPHWQFVATTGYGDRRQITESDIRWQYYAALAYGAKGIGDFSYCTPSYGGEWNDPQHAPIWWTDIDDTSTYYRADTYYYLQAVNQEISKFDHVLLSFDWQGVMTNVKNYFSDSGKALRNATDVMNSHSRIKSLSSNKNLLIGCFKDANDYDGFLLVNFDETQNNSAVNTVSITFNGAQTALAYVHGERQIVALTNGVFTCDLKPGEAVFVIPVDGTEEAPVSELAIPENATMVAYFPSCENYQGVAGVKALTDGTYTDVLPASFDYSSYSHIVLRVKAAQGASLTVGGKAVAVSTDWAEVAVKLSEISGTDVIASGNVWIDQIYAVKIAEELAIPEGAVMIQDYSSGISPFNTPEWGTGAVGFSKWYSEFDGRAGVQAFGLQATDTFIYTAWGGVLPNVDLSEYTHIVFRMKLSKSALRSALVTSLQDGVAEVQLLDYVNADNVWVEFTVKASDVNGTLLAIANTEGADGEVIWMDQVYAIKVAPELEIPEGSTLICDYSEPITPYVPGHWGSGPAAAYSNSYATKDGRPGVLGFGSNCDAFMWYTGVGMDGMDLTNAETITFRMKVDSRIRNLNIKHDNIDEYNLYQHITVFDEWTEVTVPVSDLNFADLSNASIQFQFATWNNGEVEYVLLDQVYMTARKNTPELDIPDGATLIQDFSTSITPNVPGNWGSGPAAAYANSYAEKDGRAGVLGFGSNSEAFMWYTGVGLDNMDLRNATHITFRMKVDSRIRNLNIKHDNIAEYNLYQHITEFDKWTEVTVPVADLNFADLSNASIQFQFATWNNGEVEYVLLDQVYVTCQELAIPEGATLICDYSEPITPYVPDNWGHGSAGAYYNSHDNKDGRSGVFGFGANGECFEWYTGVGMDNMDLRNATHITFRMKVDSRIRNLNIKHDNIAEYNLYQHITEFDKWTEVTIPIAELNFADLSNASIQFQFATWNNGEVEYVMLDQVYVTCQELAIPEGATLICDYSEAVTPSTPTSWGCGPDHAYYNNYAEKDGRSGVLGLGATGECFMWHTNIGMEGIDVSNATTITFRIKVDSRIRSLNFTQHNTNDYDLYSRITEFDKWIDVTINIADLNFSNPADAVLQLQFATWDNGACEYVWLDQVYIQ